MFLETDRLELFEVSELDAAFIFRILNDPDFHRYIGDRGVRTVEEARSYVIEKMTPSYHENGFGFYKVKVKGENGFVGIAGLVNRDFLDFVDIGYAFLPEGRGRGYAFEATEVVFHHAKKTLKLGRIAAITDPANERSIRLLHRLGLKFERMISFPDEDGEVKLFLSS